MFTEIKGLRDNVIGLEVDGEITAQDYKEMLIPLVEDKLKQYDKLSVLIVLKQDFDGYEFKAMIDDASIGLGHMFNWDKIAIVSDIGWINKSVNFFGYFFPARIRTFPMKDYKKAKEWVEKGDLNLSVDLDKDKKLVILEPKGHLNKEDFEYLDSIVDPYMEDGGEIKGVIVKTKKFPGWDSISGMKGHFDFIKRHHKKIDKLAFVTDTPLLNIFTSIANLVVHPEIEEFHYNEFDKAVEWILS